eukprot:s992_g6.t1
MQFHLQVSGQSFCHCLKTVGCRREILQSLTTKVCDNCNRFGGPASVWATCTALMHCKDTPSCLFDTMPYKAAE